MIFIRVRSWKCRVGRNTPLAQFSLVHFANYRNMNILVIEDDHMLRRALGHYLLDIGHTVSACSNGQEALELVKENRNIDVIIVDVLMPVLSGASFILMLKRLFPQGLPRVIIISAVREGEDFVKNLDIPFDHYIQKPIDFEELGEVVHNWDKLKAG